MIRQSFCRKYNNNHSRETLTRKPTPLPKATQYAQRASLTITSSSRVAATQRRGLGLTRATGPSYLQGSNTSCVRTFSRLFPRKAFLTFNSMHHPSKPVTLLRRVSHKNRIQNQIKNIPNQINIHIQNPYISTKSLPQSPLLAQRKFCTPAPETTTATANRKEYELNGLQKLGMIIGSSIGIALEPEKADLLAMLAESSTTEKLERLQVIMAKDRVGRRLLTHQPVISTETLSFGNLAKMAPNSFGHKYLEWMQANDFTPNKRPEVRFITQPDLRYVMLRYRQTHDFYHVLAGLEPSLTGELSIKALEALQIGLPMQYLSVLFGQFILNTSELRLLHKTAVPWARECDRSLKSNLINIEYEAHLEEDIDVFRSKIGFIPFPKEK